MITPYDASNHVNLGDSPSRDVLQRCAEWFQRAPDFALPGGAKRADTAESEVVVFGSGHMSQTFINAARKVGARIIAVVDDFRLGLECAGVQIISSRAFSQLARKHPKVIAVSGARYDRAVRHFMKLSSEVGVPMVSFEQGIRLFDLGESIDYRLSDWGPSIANRLDQYLALEQHMSDEYSRETLYSILLFHLTGNMEWVHRVYRPYPTLYFRTGLFSLTQHERFVDCGASIGESTSGVLALTLGQVDRIWMIDPDKYNQAKLRSLIDEQRPDVRAKLSLFSVAVGAEQGRLQFNHVGGHGGSIASETHAYGELEDVDIKPIDELIDAVPTLIKMDIEGSELSALKGAKNSILAGLPKMTISAYHRTADLIDLPNYVLSLSDKYRVGLRHHTEERWDTCLYFLPKS